jgi:hypothetical protein
MILEITFTKNKSKDFLVLSNSKGIIFTYKNGVKTKISK